VKCKYCLEEERRKEKISKPCNCRGSVGFVHKKCLKHWLKQKITTESRIPSCEICGCKYEIHFSEPHNSFVKFLTEANVIHVIITWFGNAILLYFLLWGDPATKIASFVGNLLLSGVMLCYSQRWSQIIITTGCLLFLFINAWYALGLAELWLSWSNGPANLPFEQYSLFVHHSSVCNLIQNETLTVNASSPLSILFYRSINFWNLFHGSGTEYFYFATHYRIEDKCLGTFYL